MQPVQHSLPDIELAAERAVLQLEPTVEHPVPQLELADPGPLGQLQSATAGLLVPLQVAHPLPVDLIKGSLQRPEPQLGSIQSRPGHDEGVRSWDAIPEVAVGGAVRAETAALGLGIGDGDDAKRSGKGQPTNPELHRAILQRRRP